MSELLPCPFCGGEAEYGLTMAGEEAYCKKCHAAMPRLTTKAEAIEAWNSRAERTCRIESSYLNDFTSEHMCWYEFEMQCGCMFMWDEMEPPTYCPSCGAKVVGE